MRLIFPKLIPAGRGEKNEIHLNIGKMTVAPRGQERRRIPFLRTKICFLKGCIRGQRMFHRRIGERNCNPPGWLNSDVQQRMSSQRWYLSSILLQNYQAGFRVSLERLIPFVDTKFTSPNFAQGRSGIDIVLRKYYPTIEDPLVSFSSNQERGTICECQ